MNEQEGVCTWQRDTDWRCGQRLAAPPRLYISNKVRRSSGRPQGRLSLPSLFNYSSRAFSASSTILLMVRKVSTGKLPLATSPLNITMLLPSSTAFATSQASARVGKGLSSMEASISVAQTMILLVARVFWIIHFWAIQIFSMGISIPRSPRATMMPSATSKISSKFAIPSTFSILAMILMLSPQCFRHSLMSSALCTKLRAM
mmetsp:Transcript_24424/g.37111  ORF Transcript_24424/g.37111 Transcript_24424/m.37111 type:complete len:203 (-) Transcript_24424:298-906(-)